MMSVRYTAMRQRRILVQAWWPISRRPWKAILTSIGVSVGVAVFIVTVGLAMTVGAAVNATFDELQATTIKVVDARTMPIAPLFGNEVDADIARLDGVVAGGQLWMAIATPEIYRDYATSKASVSFPVMAASTGALDAIEITLSSGRLYDEASVATGQPTAILGRAVAERLGLTTVEPGMAVEIDGIPVSVIGIMEESPGAPELSATILIDPRTVFTYWNVPPLLREAIIRTELGAVQSVSAALPFAISPGDPRAVGVTNPPSLEALRGDVDDSLNGMALGSAALSLLIGGVGIMNAMLISVTERSGEIGLRRAVGARSRHIIEQFTLEGLALGAVGGLIGMLAGVGALCVVSAINGWSPVLPTAVLWGTPLLGVVIGGLGAIYPAARAARLSPAVALRT